MASRRWLPSPTLISTASSPSAVTAAGMNAGQVCTATTRLLVEASVHDDVVARVVAGVERLEPGVDFGPIITEAQYTKVLDYFAAARATPGWYR